MSSTSKFLRDLAKKTNTASAARAVLKATHLKSGPGRLGDPRVGLPASVLPAGGNRITAENAKAGSAEWRMGTGKSRPGTDYERQIKGYASSDSVAVGEAIDFHVAVEPAGSFTISVYRLGYYGGASARQVLVSPTLTVGPQPVPAADPETGRIAVEWPVAWTLDVPKEWVSGTYVAVLDKADGFRNYVPFVVRDDEAAADFLVVLPSTSWQAYNWWPRDGITGRNVYYGYVTKEAAEGDSALKAKFSADARGWISNPARATQVSFARPYFADGLPDGFVREQSFIQWAEGMGYDLTYATGLDLHAGRIDPGKYRGLIFAGHDEYWSTDMYRHAEEAVAGGTSLAFLTANNAYWHVRIDESTRTMSCYKGFEDPDVEDFPTGMWRAGEGHPRAEQQLMGVQYSGILKGRHALVVREAGHWFWAGTGLKDGDEIPGLLGGEADSLFEAMPKAKAEEQALLTATPYTISNGTQFVQNTSVYRAASGTWVFTAGTFLWPLGLGHPGYQDKRVTRAMANFLGRVAG
ncbi:N,N-dimethylformamidase beta subunit family domain-containing protein [Catenulispora rubra]|uniref:N,N-dimethylformamidase beta subunit family domain-containing protein n=1 Tax=Catenulispora rubra TaxID=280293 RepID=UPI0018925367|nr:N,N-dimethylformamidase beta subunit family domain-containing protein [Catenulispora rubra]